MVRLFAACVVLLMCAAFASAQTPTPSPSPTPSPQDPCAELKAQATRSEARLRDWPALARYRDANAQLAPPAKGEPRVLFVGDSITDSRNAPRYGGALPSDPYPPRATSAHTTPAMPTRARPGGIRVHSKSPLV